jgi:hypothetical protein
VLQTTQRQQGFEAGLRRVFESSQGAMTLTVLTSTSSATLLAAVMTGDAAAKAVLQAADRLLRQIHRRSQARALECWLCDSGALWRGEPPGAVGLLTPFGIEPARVAVGMAICSSCATDRSERELAHAAVAKLRGGMLPDLRLLPPMPQAGHA